MKTNNSNLLNRRGFLKGAALLGGAAAMDVWPMPRAGASTAAGHWLTTLSYVSDDGLVDAGTLPFGDFSLVGSGVLVTIENYGLPDGTEPLFRGFVGVFMVENGSESESIPFYAWVPTTPVKRARFFMPVSPTNGISFSILTNNSQFPVESYYLATDASHKAKLRTGMYVISSRPPATAFAPKRDGGSVRLVGTSDEAPYFEHLLIDIARAE
jgi:hypothetical protein